MLLRKTFDAHNDESLKFGTKDAFTVIQNVRPFFSVPLSEAPKAGLLSFGSDYAIKVQLKTIETGCFLEITFDTGIVDP